MAIQSINRAIDILSLFTVSRPQMGITEIGEALQLSKTTVHGIIRTLTLRGFLQQDPETRKYSLGLSIYEMGTRVSETIKINQVSYGHATRLAQKTGQTIRVAVWDQDTIIITLNVTSDLENPYIQPAGIRLPAYCTALGKAILSAMPEQQLHTYLKKNIDYTPFTEHTIRSDAQLVKELEIIRKRKYAEDREESFSGISCVATPIFDHAGTPFAAIAVSGDEKFLQLETLPKIIEEMNRTAMEISRSFGYFHSVV